MRKAVVAIGFVLLAACSSDGSTDKVVSGKGCEATVHVYLQVGTSKQRERRVGDLIEGIPSVVRSSFHSNRAAYREFKKLYEKQPQIAEAKKASDFPSRYAVTLDSGQSVEDFERTLTGSTTGIERLVPGGCATPEAT